MTNEEILNKAVEKAMDNGWRGYHYHLPQFQVDIKQGTIVFQEIIFDHAFAKAFFGDSPVLIRTEKSGPDTTKIHEEAWRKHLKEMVVSEDPIQYLGSFL